jgi:hypothetical protein
MDALGNLKCRAMLPAQIREEVVTFSEAARPSFLGKAAQQNAAQNAAYSGRRPAGEILAPS